MSLGSITTVSTSTQVKLSFWEKSGFAVGDLGFNLFWATWSGYLIYFYTDVFGISATAVGTMMLLTRIVDAVVNPAMAAVADRTNTRWGKYRPYLLFGAVPMIGFAILTFTTPDFDAAGKLIWAYVTYSLMIVVYTMLNMPYSALSGVMTSDSQERTTLISFRFIAAFIGTTLVTWLTPDLVRWFGGSNEPFGWQMTMGVYGSIAAMLFVVAFASSQERIKPPVGQKTHFISDIKDLMDNKPWLVLFTLALVVTITIGLRGAVGAYYFKYFVERPDLVGAYLGVQSVGLAIGAALTPMMTRYISKRTLMVFLMLCVGVLSIIFFFVPKNMIAVMFVLNALISLALGPKSPLVFSMYADTADYTEWKTGRRATAMTFAAASFAQKLGGAVAAASIGWTLGFLGYVANQAQSGASQLGIVVLLTLVPGVVALVAAYIISRYDLDEPMMQRIQNDLMQRKNSAMV
jgi:glycoside/pentoside/hexuronide:cation symporter, GPH family